MPIAIGMALGNAPSKGSPGLPKKQWGSWLELFYSIWLVGGSFLTAYGVAYRGIWSPPVFTPYIRQCPLVGRVALIAYGYLGIAFFNIKKVAYKWNGYSKAFF